MRRTCPDMHSSDYLVSLKGTVLRYIVTTILKKISVTTRIRMDLQTVQKVGWRNTVESADQ